MEDLYKLLKQDVDDRVTWEERQSIAYKLRFGQIRRRLRPYPHASDFSWPLIDTAIEKLKPSYVEQILGPEQLASFAAKNPQSLGYTTAVGQWFDWRVKYKSNFIKQSFHMIDNMLSQGKGFLKHYYSVEHNQIRHEAIFPTMLITPVYTEELCEAERCAHVIHMPRRRYERIAEKMGYNADPAFIDRLCGKPTDDSYHQAKDMREGLGWVKQQDIIVLWEAYLRTKDGVQVYTFSPMQPKEQVRKPFKLPYRHGKIPIIQYDFEITDSGFYSPRGVSEIQQLYQSLLKMLLDMQFDYLQYCNRPVFQPDDNAPATNYNNINMAPGQVINARLKLLQFPAPPIDFIQTQQSIRAVAQERIQTPDYGIGDEQQAGQGRKTATEVQQLGASKQSGVNLHSRVFGLSLNQSYNMMFSLELQFFKDDLGYFYQKNYQLLPQDALKHDYELEANGSKDGFSRDKELQKHIQVRQLMAGQPHFKIAPCDKRILELVDPALIKDVFQDPQSAEQSEVVGTYTDIQAMINGATVQPQPTDDDKTRIQTIEAFKNYCRSHPDKMQLPDVQIRIIQYEDAHIMALKEKDPQFYKQNHQMLEGILQTNKMLMQHIQQQAQQQLAAAQGQQGAPPQGGPPPGPPGPQPGGPAAPGSVSPGAAPAGQMPTGAVPVPQISQPV